MKRFLVCLSVWSPYSHSNSLMRGVATALVVSFIMTVPLSADVTSDFENGIDGWSTINLSQPIPTPPNIVGPGDVISLIFGGNPGNAIQSTDPDGNAWYFSAPTKFLGDQSEFFGDKMNWDMRVEGTPAPPGSRSVVLVGGGLTLFGPTILDGPIGAPNGNWNTFSLDFVGSSFDTDFADLNSDATDAQLNTALEDLDSLYILGDWTEGSESTSLDNFQFSAVPEPSSSCIVVTALVCAVFRRRRISVRANGNRLSVNRIAFHILDHPKQRVI